MLLTWGSSQGLNALMNSAEFIAGFADKGSGEVDLTLAKGTGSATFTRATTATTVNSAGLIVSVASGTPRSYYDPTTLQYLGYLAEGARTNLCLQSNAFTTTWVQFSGTASFSQNVTGPDGVSNSAWTITDPGAATVGPSQPISLTNATTYSVAAFVKKTTGGLTNYPAVTAYNAGYSVGCVVNTTAGTATAITVYQGATIGTTNGITVQGFGDYWRVSFNFTANATASWSFTLHPAYNATGTGAENTATSGSAVFYGAQLEAGSFASTYIPTTTASVTRNADVLTYPFAGNASATEGTIYAEVSPLGGNASATFQFIVSLNEGAGNEQISLNRFSQTIYQQVVDGGVLLVDQAGGDVLVGATGKCAETYIVNNFKVTVNGATPTVDTTGAIPTPTQITIGHRIGDLQLYGCTKNVRIYQTQLSASQLQAVTA